jgi:hypothetical protein
LFVCLFVCLFACLLFACMLFACIRSRALGAVLLCVGVGSMASSERVAYLSWSPYQVDASATGALAPEASLVQRAAVTAASGGIAACASTAAASGCDDVMTALASDANACPFAPRRGVSGGSAGMPVGGAAVGVEASTSLVRSVTGDATPENMGQEAGVTVTRAHSAAHLGSGARANADPDVLSTGGSARQPVVDVSTLPSLPDARSRTLPPIRAAGVEDSDGGSDGGFGRDDSENDVDARSTSVETLDADTSLVKRSGGEDSSAHTSKLARHVSFSTGDHVAEDVSGRSRGQGHGSTARQRVHRGSKVRARGCDGGSGQDPLYACAALCLPAGCTARC